MSGKGTMEMRASMLSGKNMPVERFFGVGARRAEAFHKLGIHTARDLVYHFPRAYEPRGNVRTTGEVADGEVCSLVLTVNTEPKTATVRRGMVITKLTAFDDFGKCGITFFNQPYVKDALTRGATFRFFGKVRRDGFSVSMTSPVFEPYNGAVPLRPLVPVYPLTQGISQKLMGSTVRAALDAVFSGADSLQDFLPCDLRARYGLCELKTALFHMHLPESVEDTASAVRRLAFDELYLFALSMLRYGKNAPVPSPYVCRPADRDRFLSLLPYQLTAAQERTRLEVEADMTSGMQMRRLIVGDVGSGKTVLAAYAVYTALASGWQAALMAPTEILARQHFGQLSSLFEALGYRVALLVGSMTAAAKRKVQEALSHGDVDFVIGTHALIEDGVVFARLGLAVIDEQHRFGTAQRAALVRKGREGAVHLLSMSATPIPRTLAMVLYCDTDISILDEMPPGRQKVDTFFVNESYRARLNAFIRKNIDAGGQVYIVCPAVEEQEKLEGEGGLLLAADELIPPGGAAEEKPKLKAAVDYAKALSEEVFPEYRVAFLHGRLPGKEKDRIMKKFAAGELDILVSTTVIEVGVNVPRATLMLVENAEFFGLSALHQLRGRVGRGERKSYCILVSDSNSEKVRERLGILCETNDGFQIAKRDLEMRGPGDFIEQAAGKTRQSGEFDLGLASLEHDEKLLYAAFEEARRTLIVDPALSLPEHAALCAVLEEKNVGAKNESAPIG
ncbi:MAG: ATP-dependent DNA helicase RecG [Clostridiales bacterium]|nr:MAG: ATP-dependent DNA helicase RecG [Clostridiales bacterium]